MDVGGDLTGEVVLGEVEVSEVGAVIQGCRELSGDGVVGEVELR